MNTPITFTPYEIYVFAMLVCNTIITLSAAILVIVKFRQKTKEPEEEQNRRITELEKKVTRYEQLFDNDNKRLIALEKGNRVTQKALLALLSHAINGNDTEDVTKAKKALEEHLLGKDSMED